MTKTEINTEADCIICETLNISMDTLDSMPLWRVKGLRNFVINKEDLVGNIWH